jgi:hydrogenase maturation protease
VRVEDFGIRGVHLAYELLEGYDGLVIIDAVPMGEPPGTLAVIEPEPDAVRAPADCGRGPVVDAHTMNPDVVLATLRAWAGPSRRSSSSAANRPTSKTAWGSPRPWPRPSRTRWQLCFQLVSEMVEPVTKGDFP